MKKVSIQHIANAVKGKIINENKWRDITLEGVSTDTRTIEENQLFIPLKGENFDGHNFIDKAYSEGAILSFTEDENLIKEDKVAILVEDTFIALTNFAKYYRSLFNIPIVAITGSVGKTSTKEMIYSMLSTSYNVHKTSGNYNNEIGVPLTLFKLEEYHDIAVIEMGMNHYGELHRLSELVRPSIAVITNIGVSHIEYFGNKDGILKAKEEILDYLEKDGLIIINGDDKYLQKLISKYGNMIRTYGVNKSNECILDEYKSKNDEGQKVIVKSNSNIYDIEVDYIGKHILLNSLAGIIICELFNMSKHKIIEGIKNYKPEKMRLNISKLKDNITLIDDCYNASVDSMKSAIETLISIKNNNGKSIAILGSMFEMGDYSKEGHREVGKLVVDNKVDKLICIGKEAKYIAESAVESNMNRDDIYIYNEQEDFIDNISNIINKNDTIIVKASRGMHFENIIKQVKKKF